jgi:hypothetical protein
MLGFNVPESLIDADGIIKHHFDIICKSFFDRHRELGGPELVQRPVLTDFNEAPSAVRP